jgi:hypothetical protein
MEDDYIWTFDEENPEEAFLVKVREILAEIAKLCRRVRKDLKLSISTARKSGFSYPIAETHRSEARESWGD